MTEDDILCSFELVPDATVFTYISLCNFSLKSMLCLHEVCLECFLNNCGWHRVPESQTRDVHVENNSDQAKHKRLAYIGQLNLLQS